MKRISHYEIVGEAGRGGMATVFLAEDTRIKRQVVIKVLPAYFMHDKQFRDRFLQEARVLVTLSHPNIVPVYEFGEEVDQPYLVMRYMSGGTLGERIERGPLDIDEAVEILKPIASALDYAHGKGIVHRDMKPGNILFDESGAAYLADFGIVKLAEATRSFTGSAIIGTPAYMSPEQVKGGQDIDGRSDVYSLGVILYEMLTGEVPYQGDTPTQQLMKHVLEPPPSIRQVRSDIPAEIEAVLLKALAKEPVDRYPTAAAFVTALANPQGSSSPETYIAPATAIAGIGAGAPNETAPPATNVLDYEYEPLPGMKRGGRSTNRLAIGAIAAMLLLLIAGVAYTLTRTDPDPPLPGPTETPTAAPDEGDPAGTALARQTAAAELAVTQTAVAELKITQTAEAVAIATAKALGDDDEDGLANQQEEEEYGTNPNKSDSDSDGLDDRAEVNGPTDPLQADTDGDGLLDGQEVNQYQTDPINADTDGDGLSDGEELSEHKTDPKNRDTDRDGDSDGDEIIAGTNPGKPQPPTLTPTHTPESPTLAPTSPPEPPTLTPTSPPPPAAGPDWRQLGSTVLGKPIQVAEFGTGPNRVVLIGGIHAGAAPASVTIGENLVSHFTNNPGELPGGVTVYVVPSLNKDSAYAPGEWAGRINANDVDLNRNWDCNWVRDAAWRGSTIGGSGGSAPFSEPETKALRDFLLQTDPDIVIVWGARVQGGLVSPGKCGSLSSTTQTAGAQAGIYASAAGYPVADYQNETGQVINGDLTDWLERSGIPAFSVLLDQYENPDWTNTLKGVRAILNSQ